MLGSTKIFRQVVPALLGAVMGGLGYGATIALAAPPTEPVLTAQLFRRSPSPAPVTSPNAGGCGPQGCRLNIRSTLIPSGTKVKATYTGKETQVFSTGETRQMALKLKDPILTSSGQILVPADSLIQGEVVPVSGGGQYRAKVITVNGKPYNFPAQSDTIHDVKDPRQTTVGSIATDAAIGGAGAAVLGQVLAGRVNPIEVLGGAAAGVIVGNVTAGQAVVINQGDEFQLQLTENFQM